MESYSVHYKFSQHFDFPVKDAFEWSMDYREDDIARIGKVGRRGIKRINEDTLILSDVYFSKKGNDTKRRLIRIYPERFTMINTRVSAANKHSQFIYEFVAEGEKSSRLDFTGSHVFYGKRPPPSRISALAREMAEEDGNIWKNLAKEMEKDLRPKR